VNDNDGNHNDMMMIYTSKRVSRTCMPWQQKSVGQPMTHGLLV
jgi:hypothetical protein